MHYVIGNFNGEVFKEDNPAKFLDYGPDYYAAVTFNDAAERISIGWMNNWAYAHDAKFETSRTWNGSMTAARKLSIVDGELKQQFIGEVQNYKIDSSVTNVPEFFVVPTGWIGNIIVQARKLKPLMSIQKLYYQNAPNLDVFVS